MYRFAERTRDDAPGTYWPMIQAGIIKNFAVLDLRNPGTGQVQNPRSNVVYIQFGMDYSTARLTIGNIDCDVLIQGNSTLRNMAASLSTFGL